jgi:hypothetical protein
MKKGQKQAPSGDSIDVNGAVALTQEPITANGDFELEQEIRMRAHELFVERGKRHGHHFDDWLRAERECRERWADRQSGAQAQQVQS